MRGFCFLPVFLATTAVADVEGLKACAGVADNTARLACYDALADRRRGQVAARPTGERPPVATHKPVASKIQQPRSRTPGSAPSILAPAARDFSLGHRHQRDVEKVVSRYDGEFTGWSGHTLFRLENGQVWRQADGGRYKTRLARPIITIERAAFGTYKLRIEGLRRSVRVKRVR